MNTNLKTKVLIVGAGPVGLMLANQLTKFGIDYIIIDSKSGPTIESRAHSISPRSMELFQQLDLSDTIINDGAKLDGFYIFSYGKTKANVNFVEAGKNISDFSNVFYSFEQFKTEELLYNNINSKGQTVNWNTEFVKLEETPNSIISEVKNQNDVLLIESDYIVGTDGARSLVRHSGNFKFDGGEYAKKFFVTDLEIDWDENLQFEDNKVIMEPSDDSFVFFFPYKEKNRYRVMGELPLEYENVKNITDEDCLKTIFSKTSFKFKVNKIFWNSSYKVHHRVVDKYIDNRIILAGDSAHLHSPLGGHGMNTGLQDAHNLGWKLAYVINNQASLGFLDTYNDERLSIAKDVVNTTDKYFSYLISPKWIIKNIRKNVVFPLMSLFLKFKVFQRLAYKKLSQINISYNSKLNNTSNTIQNTKFVVGNRVPLVRPGFLNNFKKPMFNLIIISNNPKSELEIVTIKQNFGFEVNILQELITPEWKNLGVKSELYVVVRPDHFISMISDTVVQNYQI